MIFVNNKFGTSDFISQDLLELYVKASPSVSFTNHQFGKQTCWCELGIFGIEHQREARVSWKTRGM